MATTTASITLSSNDLIPGMPLTYYKQATLDKADGCSGLEEIQRRMMTYRSTGQVDLLTWAATVAKEDGANKIYIKNHSPLKTEYCIISIGGEVLGRIYGQDWCFFPWSGGSTNDIEVNPQFVGSSMVIEYILIHEI